MLSYRCPAECRHCMYACSPKWKGDWITVEQLERHMPQLAELIEPSPYGRRRMDLSHGLQQAFMKRGLPRSLMTDSGPAMVAEEIEQGLLRLGIHHARTLPYSPHQNGKQEVFWSQVEGRLMAMLENCRELTLTLLNEATQAWDQAIDVGNRVMRKGMFHDFMEGGALIPVPWDDIPQDTRNFRGLLHRCFRDTRALGIRIEAPVTVCEDCGIRSRGRHDLCPACQSANVR